MAILLIRVLRLRPCRARRFGSWRKGYSPYLGGPSINNEYRPTNYFYQLSNKDLGTIQTLTPWPFLRGIRLEVLTRRKS